VEQNCALLSSCAARPFQLNRATGAKLNLMKTGSRSGRSTPTDGSGRSGRNTPTTESVPLTISDLPPEEKAKIQNLAERLVALGREHEETVSNLSNERARHAAEIDAANRRIENELDAADAKLVRQGESIALLQEQRAAAFSLLTQYQARLETYDDEVKAKGRAAEDLRRKLVEAGDDVARLEKTVESQRAHMEGIEAASVSAKRLFEEALQAAEERGRRLAEDVTLATDRARESERRSQGLETAVGGLTKQINSMKRAAAGSAERLAELTKLVEAKELEIAKEKALRASSVAEAEAAVTAAAAATAAKMAAEKAAFEMPSRPRSRRSRPPLAASATSSEMLLLDTYGEGGPGAGGESGTEGEQTAASERSARRRVKSRAKSGGDKGESSRQNSYSPARAHALASVLRPHSSMTVRRLPATSPAPAPAPAAAAVSNKLSRKKATDGAQGKAAAASASSGARVSASLAEELGQHRRYDLSLLYLLEGM